MYALLLERLNKAKVKHCIDSCPGKMRGKHNEAGISKGLLILIRGAKFDKIMFSSTKGWLNNWDIIAEICLVLITRFKGMLYLSYELYQIFQVFVHNNKYFLLKLWEIVKNRKTCVVNSSFFKNLKKIIRPVKQKLL